MADRVQKISRSARSHSLQSHLAQTRRTALRGKSGSFRCQRLCRDVRRYWTAVKLCAALGTSLQKNVPKRSLCLQVHMGFGQGFSRQRCKQMCSGVGGGKRSTFSEMAGGVRSQIGDVTDSLLASTAAGFPYSEKTGTRVDRFAPTITFGEGGGDDPVLRDRFNVAIRCSTLKMLGSFPRVLAQISPCKVKMK